VKGKTAYILLKNIVVVRLCVIVRMNMILHNRQCFTMNSVRKIYIAIYLLMKIPYSHDE